MILFPIRYHCHVCIQPKVLHHIYNQKKEFIPYINYNVVNYVLYLYNYIVLKSVFNGVSCFSPSFQAQSK